MKTLQPLFATLALVFCITSIAHGVEYKTLKTPNAQTPNSEIDVLPTDMVEVVSCSNDSSGTAYVTFQFQDGYWAIADTGTKKQSITGISKFRLLGGGDFRWVTVKITPAEAVAPTTVLVLPEAPGGNTISSWNRRGILSHGRRFTHSPCYLEAQMRSSGYGS